MSKFIRISLLVLVGVILTVTPVFAYLYHAPLTITETSSNSYDMLPVVWTQNNDWLADNGFMDADALDTRVQTFGGLNKPWMVAEDRTLTAVPVPADSQTNLYFTTGETPAASMDIIVGDGGTITTVYHADLELGANGSITLTDAYIDAEVGTSDTLLLKADTLRICDSDVVDNYVAAYIPSVFTVMVNQGAFTGQDPITTTSWAAQTFTATKSALISRVSVVNNTVSGNPANITASLRATAAGLPTGDDLAILETQACVPAGGATTFTFNCPYFIANGSTYAIVLRKSGAGDTPQWYYSNVNPYAGGTRCTSADSGATWVASAGDDYATTIYYCDGSAVGSVTAGEHDITVEVDGATFDLTVDTTTVPEAFVGAVPNNANNYVLYFNDTLMPYIGAFEIAPAGADAVYYQPNTMIAGTTMPNRAAGFVGSHDGTINWGANPAGVAAAIGSMVSSGQTDIGAIADTGTGDILPAVGGTDWRPTPGVSAALLANPLRPIVTAISDNTTLSEYQVWVWLGIIFVMFITVLVGANVRGHHLITGIAASAAIVLMVVWTIFPLLTLVIIVIAIWGGLVSERSPTL